MINSYDLFSAMSGVDEELIARSDFRVKRSKRELFAILTAAACVAIILSCAFFLFVPPAPQSLYNPPATVPPETGTTEAPTLPPDRPLRLNGANTGTLNIIQLSQAEETISMPDFLMYVNSERYNIAEGSGTYYILPISHTENTPLCQMSITWEPDVTVESFAKQQISALSSSMELVSDSPTDLVTDGLMIHGSSGSQWDSAQTEIYLTSDGQSGIFVFTLNYYLEDTDEHAIWFRDMLQTFELVTSDREAPEWLTELYSTVERFTDGFLKNDFSDMQELIAKNAEIYTYDSDVLAKTRVLKTHYKVDHDATPKTASVSVRHKYQENDAYDYITMELTYSDGKWQVLWAMIER